MGEFEEAVKQGDSFYDKGKFLDAVRSYLKALELDVKDDQSMADLHYKLSQGFHEMDRKRTDESIQHGTAALELHRKISDQESVVGDLLNLAYIMLDVKDDKTAEEYVNTALKEASGREDLEVEVKLTLADMYSSSKRKRNDALKLYEEIARTSSEAGLHDSYFAAYYGIISIRRDSGDVDGAFKMAMKSLDDIDSLCAQIKNKKERANVKKSLSFMYDMASDLAMDLENISQAIEIAERMKKE